MADDVHREGIFQLIKKRFFLCMGLLNCDLLCLCAVGVSPVCMHIILCAPGVVTWGDAKTKEPSDQYITSYFIKIQEK